MPYPRFDRDFILDTDSREASVGAVLSQKDDDGTERVITCGSQSLTKAERGYSVTRKEILSRVLEEVLSALPIRLSVDAWRGPTTEPFSGVDHSKNLRVKLLGGCNHLRNTISKSSTDPELTIKMLTRYQGFRPDVMRVQLLCLPLFLPPTRLSALENVWKVARLTK
jgi:hypothetical protein